MTPEPVVQPGADDILAEVHGDRTAVAGHAAGDAAAVRVQILDLGRPRTGDDELDTGARGPAEIDLALVAERLAEDIRREIADRGAGGHVGHDAIERIAEPQAGGC